MTDQGSGTQGMVSDEELVAYLDGELDPADRERVERALARDESVQARLAELDAAGPQFAQAFDALLDAAPRERLEAMADELAPTNVVAMPTRARRPMGPPAWAAMAASLVLVLGLGVGLGWVFGQPEPAPPQGWRAAAAGYVKLFTPETFEAMPADPAAVDAALAFVSERLGRQLSRERVQATGLELKQAELLEFNDKPLAQIAYLYGATTPVALCIIPSAKPDAAAQTEERESLSVVHWVRGGFGYMLIGGVDSERLKPIAAELERALL